MSYPTVSAEEKQIARYLSDQFGQMPKFHFHRETEDDPTYVAIGVIDNQPGTGLSTLATNGLSNHPLFNDDGSVYTDTRLEFIGTCSSDQTDDFREMIFFAANTIIKQKWFCAPGTFLRNAVSKFGNFGEMQHLYFATPFVFDGFETTMFGGRTVSWLTPIPVSTAEMKFAQENSTEALEDIFEEVDFDWQNLGRSSIV